MRANTGTGWLVPAATLAGLAAIVAGLAMAPDAVEGWRLAARWTARVSLCFFLAAYLAGTVARLVPGTSPRGLGFGFATAHLLHLGALVAHSAASGLAPAAATLLVGGAGYLVVALMAATSPPAWPRLHAYGLHYVWIVFALTYGSRLGAPETVETGLAGLVLLLAAFAARLVMRRRARAAAL